MIITLLLLLLLFLPSFFILFMGWSKPLIAYSVQSFNEILFKEFSLYLLYTLRNFLILAFALFLATIYYFLKKYRSIIKYSSAIISISIILSLIITFKAVHTSLSRWNNLQTIADKHQNVNYSRIIEPGIFFSDINFQTSFFTENPEGTLEEIVTTLESKNYHEVFVFESDLKRIQTLLENKTFPTSTEQNEQLIVFDKGAESVEIKISLEENKFKFALLYRPCC